jgi:hypothetical protein
MRFVGVTVEQRQVLHIPQAVVHAIYGNDPTLRNTVNSYMANNRHDKSTATKTSPESDARGSASGTDGTSEGAWRKVDAANRRFSENEKYSGILAESPILAEARDNYITYCNQKEFSRADCVKLVSCVLKGPALNYWMSNIERKDEFTELASVFMQFEVQFDTPAHQRQIESLSYSLTLKEVKKKNCNRISALGYIYHEVARLNEQFPKVKRGEQFRTQTLMKIVERYEWSRTAEEEVMQDTLTFDSLYTKLLDSIFIWENEVLRSGHDPDLADDSRKPVGTATYFAGYGAQYAIQSSVDFPWLYLGLPLDISIADKLVRKIHLHPLAFRNGIIETIGANMKLIVSNAVSKATGLRKVATMRQTRC